MNSHPLDDVPALIAAGGIKIFAIFPDLDTPSFAYSVGMTSRDRPELAMSGFSSELMYDLIRLVSQQTVPLNDGTVLTGLATVPLVIRAWPATETSCQPLVLARRYYDRIVPIHQIVVPDPDGLYPWNAGCDPLYVELQSRFGDLTGPLGDQDLMSVTSRMQ
jgi:hypothetical protein